MYPPYRCKVVEALPCITRKQRSIALKHAGFNPFQISADKVIIDLISDSGTGAMSSDQWAAMFQAREDFSGQKAYQDFIALARKTMGMRYIQPVHQGRAAEHLLFQEIMHRDSIVAGNTHFETTRDNLQQSDAIVIDLPDNTPPFCGNINIPALRKLHNKKNVDLVILTLTSNTYGGQPVSLQNIKAVERFTRSHNIPLVFDASRFADNAYFIKQLSNSRMTIQQIVTKMFEYADIVYMSCKKSGLVNIGGMIASRKKTLMNKLMLPIIQQESYPTAGGLAARDLAAMARGLNEALDYDQLATHHAHLQHLAKILKRYKARIFEPIGGHAIAIQPRSRAKHAAFALAALVYLETGIRGGVFDDCYRLALPRRVYSREHLEFVGERIGALYQKALPALKIKNQPAKFFNFFAQFTAQI